MSSAEEQPEGAAQLFDREKKRKIPRACDLCRRRKIRCDGGEIPGHRCSNCVAYESECTYLQPAAKKRNPPKGYVESLERRVSNMEKILQTLFPDTDLKDLDGEVDVDRWLLSRTIGNLPSNTSNSSDSAFSTTTPGLSPLLLSSNVDSQVVQTEEEYAHEPLAGDLKQPSLQLRDRFFGKSSSFLLVKKAINMKQEYGDGIQQVTPVNGHRDEFWKSSPWEDASSVDRHHYDFPPDDLMQSLVHLYFTQVNISSPVLHRPIFERSIVEKLHLRNELFAATLLAVVAIGSRYSDDPRVFLDNTNSPNSCGWKWFSQVPRNRMRRSALEPPSLYELQLLTLLTIYGVGSSAPQECWTWIGVGIRLAQEVGAHRRKPLGYKMTVEDELWKRAFWILVCMDKFISAFLGRPCAMHDEDFDLDLPAECDDEYWEHPDPDMAFKQPANKPSTMAYFVSYLKLYKILGAVLRTIYAINKSPVPLGFVGKKWEQQTVAELDSALNSWVDSIPDHLRWDPHCQNPMFFIQSVSLYTSYYHIQILIHRPFIPSSQHPSPLTFPSLAICANAARSSCHVADVLLQRGIMALPHMQISTFTAGIILLLNIWSGKKSGISINANREMEDVHKCMNVLRACESRFHPAGRFWDVLCGLATMGNLPLPVYPERTSKRGRDFNEAELECSVAYPSGNYNGAIASTTEDPKWLSHMAPSATVNSALEKLAVAQNQPTTYPLPMYSNELGRLPLHGEFNFADETQFGYTYDNSCTLNEPTYAVQSSIPALPVANPYPIEHAPSYMMDQQLYDQMAKIFASNFVDPTGLDIELHQNMQVHERTSNPYPPSFPSGSQPDHSIYPARYQ